MIYIAKLYRCPCVVTHDWGILNYIIMHDLINSSCFVFLLSQETLRVKDEELQHLAKDIRSRDATIKEIADKLTETAEAAASAAHTMDEQRRLLCLEIERLKNALERQIEQSMHKVEFHVNFYLLVL